MYRSSTILLMGWLCVYGADASAQATLDGRVFYGSTHPTVDETFFKSVSQGDSGYHFRAELGYEFQNNVMTGATMYAVEATTFPYLNQLDEREDLREQLALSRAYWNIARYYATLSQARMRREIGGLKTFGTSQMQRQSLAQEISATTQRDWGRTTEALAKESEYGRNLLRSIAFEQEYATAIDTIRMPVLTESPHGMYIYFGGVGTFPISGEDLGAGGGFNLGLGYRYRRFKVGYQVASADYKPRGSSAEVAQLVDGRGTWSQLAFGFGYDVYVSPGVAATASAYLGGATLESGSGDEQVKHNDVFSPGFALDVNARLGGGRLFGAGLPAGQRLSRPAIGLLLRVSGFRAAALSGASVFVPAIGAGVYMDVSGMRYR